MSVVPNFCWYSGAQYECGLSLSCVFAGAKAMDLCNGGMIWSCCVPRDRISDQVITYMISAPVCSYLIFSLQADIDSQHAIANASKYEPLTHITYISNCLHACLHSYSNLYL